MSIISWSRSCPAYFGTGALDLLPEKAKELGMSKVLMVTEADLIKFKVATQVKDKLESNGIKVVLFDQVSPDPSDTVMNAGGEICRTHSDINGVIGCGGGSSLDSAKGISLLSGNPGKIGDYYVNTNPDVTCKKGLPLICIPTTAGTGSEMSAWIVVSDTEAGLKRNTPPYPADIAIIDPSLTYTLPQAQTCATGLDALAHAIGAIASASKPNPFAYVLGYESTKLIFEWLPVAVREPNNKKAREKMAMAASFSGMILMELVNQFDHCFGEAFGGKFHMPHGICAAWGLPGALAMAGKFCFDKAAYIAPAMGITVADDMSPDELSQKMVDKVVGLMKACSCQSLKAAGFTLEQCQSVAEDMMTLVTYQFFPKKNMSVDEIREYIKITYEAYQ